jgi:hypothetical protein
MFCLFWPPCVFWASKAHRDLKQGVYRVADSFRQNFSSIPSSYDDCTNTRRLWQRILRGLRSPGRPAFWSGYGFQTSP